MACTKLWLVKTTCTISDSIDKYPNAAAYGSTPRVLMTLRGGGACSLTSRCYKKGRKKKKKSSRALLTCGKVSAGAANARDPSSNKLALHGIETTQRQLGRSRLTAPAPTPPLQRPRPRARARRTHSTYMGLATSARSYSYVAAGAPLGVGGVGRLSTVTRGGRRGWWWPRGPAACSFDALPYFVLVDFCVAVWHTGTYARGLFSVLAGCV